MIYGLIIIFLAIDAWFLGLLPGQFLPVAVIIMGALVLFTPIGGGGPFNQPTFSQKIIRFVFGIALVVLGLASLFPLGYENLPFYTVDALSAQLILLLIGVIYLLSGTRTGNIQIRSY